MLSPESPSDETITEKLLGDNAGPKDYDESEASQSREHESRWRFLAVASSSLLVVSLVFNGVLFYKNLHRGVDVDRPYIFSPAQDAIEYTTKVFHSNFGDDRTPYQGPPSDEVDAAWEALYNDAGINRIDGAMAAQLPNRTTRIPGDDDGYVVGLDVLHQLHCLNMLRKSLYPDRYDLYENLTGVELRLAKNHTEHCVDSIRQSLMCSADISTIYWQWDKYRQRAIANAQSTHVCRNFDKIHTWAKEHAIGDWDPSINTELQA